MARTQTPSEYQREMDRRRRRAERDADRVPSDAADRIGDALHAAARNRPPRAVQPVVDFDGVPALVEMLRQVVGRPMSLAPSDTRTITQRCRACCAEIRTRVDDDWSTTLAHAIRVDYDMHRCTPIDVQLHGCSADELTLLHDETEAELVRVAVRADAIHAELLRRGP